jgi:hypothetical protein
MPLPADALAGLQPQVAASVLLCEAVGSAEGFSGRSLRKLPLQAHANFVRSASCSAVAFATAVKLAVAAERDARGHL